MKLQHQIDRLQAQRASEWFEILKRGQAEDWKAFADWCKQSPLHIQEFLEITWTDRVLRNLDPGREENVDAMLRQISAQPALQVERSSHLVRAPAPSKALRSSTLWRVAAALVICVAGLGLYRQYVATGQSFETRPGEQRTLELADGSVITLNTDSAVAVRLRRNSREIQLRRGEAVFKVAHDPRRPFRVHVAEGIIQDVGTQFDVYDRARDGVEVVVLEGRVVLSTRADVAAPHERSEALTAGQGALLGVDGSISRSEHADLARVLAWSKRRLRFEQASLEDIVHEFNRYHVKPKLRLEGVSSGSHHYSGIFDADTPSSLIGFLEQEPDLRLEPKGDEIIIRPRVARAP